MKYIAAILFSAGVMCAANFLTGQSARAVIGQSNFTAQAYDNPAGELGGVSGLAFANGALFVVDSNRVGSIPDNDRVVIYSSLLYPVWLPGSSLPLPTQEIADPIVSNPSFIRCPVCVIYESVIVGQADYVTVGVPAAGRSASSLNQPAGVASDGKILVVADTNNNRVLIWNSIPTTNNAPANVVLGQTGFTAVAPGTSPPTLTASSMRGPESVWIQGNQLFVADTLDNRILIWNSIPTQNNQPADLVLGQPNFTTTQSARITVAPVTTASDIISPTGVSSDGAHLFVADLGQNRVLIWNTIPTQNNQPADVEIGQPSMTTAVANYSFTGIPSTSTTDKTDKETPVLCTTPVANGADSNSNPTYPQRCAATLDWPRYVLSDGTRLFVADSGNDRVLVYNTIPTQNAARADVVLGEPDEFTDRVSDSGSATDNVTISGADTMRTPMALAWDGNNLYVSDPFDRRVVVYSASEQVLAANAVLNAASLETFSSGLFSFAGTITTGEVVAVTITDTSNGTTGYTAPTYSYTVAKSDTFDSITAGVVKAINGSNSGAGDPLVHAFQEAGAATVLVSAITSGVTGNNYQYSVAITGVSGNAATLTVSPTSATLTGGTDAATLAPGMLISVTGPPGSFTDQPATSAPAGAPLPLTLGGAEMYIDGVQIPLLSVSPGQTNTPPEPDVPAQIEAQIPYEFADSNGGTGWVRTVHSDGSVTVTNSVAIPIAPENPGLFTTTTGADPRPGLAFQYSSNAVAVVDLEGTPVATTVATVTIGSTPYTYTVQSADVPSSPITVTLTNNGTTTTASVTPDVLEIIRESLMTQINADPNAPVTASEASQYHYLLLTAKTAGAAGNGIAVTSTTSGPSSSSLTITVLTSYGSASTTATCCASAGGTQISESNPAVPGGFVVLYAAGMGAVVATPVNGIFCPVWNSTFPLQNYATTGAICAPDPNAVPVTGAPYAGPAENQLISPVSAVAGGATANVIDANMIPGSVGLYRLLLQLSSSLTSNPLTPVTVYENVYNSNTVTIPVQAQ